MGGRPHHQLRRLILGSSLSNGPVPPRLVKVEPTLIHRLFYPQVPLVLAASAGGRVSAMPVVSYASVSESPPMVAVSCNPESFTCKLAVKAGSFSLSLLDADRTSDVARLATVSGRKTKDKLQAVGVRYSRGSLTGAPVIEGAEATLELAIKTKRAFGDHLLLVGDVKSATASTAFSDSWDFRQYSPILYSGWRDGMTTYKVPSTN